MIPALVRRGFGYGSGVIDPRHERFLLNMPKNASSYMLDWSTRHGWRTALLSDHANVGEMIVILRDPIQRWISGVAQYVRSFILSVHGPNGPVFPGQAITRHDYVMTAHQFREQYTDLTERLFFDVIDRFDDHVWPQVELIPDTVARKTWFYMDQDLNNRIGTYLGFDAIEGLDRNTGSKDRDTADIQDFFRERLRVRPELVSRLRRHYERDYELIDRVLDAN